PLGGGRSIQLSYGGRGPRFSHGHGVRAKKARPRRGAGRGRDRGARYTRVEAASNSSLRYSGGRRVSESRGQEHPAGPPAGGLADAMRREQRELVSLMSARVGDAWLRQP